MRSLQGHRSRFISLAVGAGIVLSMDSALADAATKNNSNASKGIMTFENVRVVNAPDVDVAPQKRAALGGAKSEGLRAYIDPSRRLRPQTSEERNKIADDFAAKQSAKELTRSGRSQSQDAALSMALDSNAGTRTIYGPGNAVGVQLTEEHMVYQIAHKTDDGLVREELTGKSAAKQAVRSATKNLAKEVSHAR